MLTNDDLRKEVQGWQKPLLTDYADGCVIHFRKELDGLWSAYAADPPAGVGEQDTRRSDPTFIPRTSAIVVGLDIREYSRRTAEQQLFLTMILHASIHRALDLLHDSGTIPDEEPRIIVQTGDGAYVVFTLLEGHNPFVQKQPPEAALSPWTRANPSESWPLLRTLEGDLASRQAEQRRREDLAHYLQDRRRNEQRFLPVAAHRAFSFIFALNAIMNGDNARQGFIDDSMDHTQGNRVKVFPARARFAVSYDDVLLLEDVNGCLNCVGNGMVTCARVLGSDHGNHLLVHDRLMDDLEPFGGILKISEGQWGQRLHNVMLPDVKIKTGHFRYADVFGFYHDRPLLTMLGRQSQPETTYHIGSHNVKTLDSD